MYRILCFTPYNEKVAKYYRMDKTLLDKPTVLMLSRPYISPKELTYLHSKTIEETQKLVFNERKRLVFNQMFQIIKTLKFPLRVLNTTMIYYQKFYLFNKFLNELEDYSNLEKNLEHNPFTISLACLFLASKNEDCIKKLRDIQIVANKLRDKQLIEDPNFLDLQRKVILLNEFKLLQIIKFNFNNQILFSIDILVLQFSKKLGLDYKYTMFAWLVCFDLMITPLNLMLPPHCIALAAIIVTLNFAPDDLIVSHNTGDVSNSKPETVLDKLNCRDFNCPELLVNEGIIYILDFYVHQYKVSMLTDYLPPLSTSGKEQTLKFMNIKSQFNNLKTIKEFSVNQRLLQQDESLDLWDYSIALKGSARFVNKRKRFNIELPSER